ncbi:hypothetical protein [Dactylosporangium matsuzakiense]|uniref:Uncharacterized protein n=1 Tax=Dactylosporangium matsuzakiense TaxID=53360 RepID=A0A9W6KMU5_9ACTN|nr:hypothetical protein [Dactylosporangium matsuzakiense]GLL04343.1 hypothetical protein GCM10017581_060900 [Dactylosporangium matsuzakiense]
MPAAETTGPPGVKRSTQLLQLLFWGGVGLAPLAALLFLVGSGFILQFAAVIGLLAVVLIGLSIALRREGETVKGEVEEMMYEEIDTLRENVRADITHAARQTHGQLMERMGVLNETVDALRSQVEMMRGQLGQLERAAAQPPPAPSPQAAAAAVPLQRYTETVHVTTKTTVVDPSESRTGTVYGGGPRPEPRADIPQQRRPDRSERISARPEMRPDAHDEPRRAQRDERPRERDWRDEPRREAPRRDEPRREEPRRDESWTEQLLRERMERAESGEWPQAPRRGERPEPTERRAGGRRRADDDDSVAGLRQTDRWASVHSDERGGRELRMGERRSAMHADETGTHVSIEDRWASVRQEEYYSGETRAGGNLAGPGERRMDRSEERHMDRSGERHLDRTGEHRGVGRRRAEPEDRAEETLDARFEERYSAGTESPRRSEARRERERTWASGEHARVEVGRRPEETWSQTSYEEARRDQTGSTRWSEVRGPDRALGGPRPALPASPAEPASRWTDGPVRDEERVGRRARVEDDDEYGWNGARDDRRGGRAPRPIVDFEGNDDRWR